MEASTRLLHLGSSTRRPHFLLSKPFPSRLLNPNPNPARRFLPLPKLPSCPRGLHSPHCFSDSLSPKFPSCHRRNPFLSLTTSPSHSLSSSSPQAANQVLSTSTNPASSSPPDRPHQCSNLSDLGFGAAKAATWTVVLLGWLGAEEKHMKRYAEMYGARGFRTVRFVVSVRDTLGLDLCRNVEERIQGLAAEIAGWCAEGDRDGMERNLLFHTFSNTGWLAYGVLLQNFQLRSGIIEKIKGCVVDSAPSAEISPKVFAAGYCAALLKKRNLPLVESVEGHKLDGSNVWNAQDIVASMNEIVVLKVLEIFFSLALMLPYANQRLSSIISTLKEQPPYPQLYLYSSADKVIPASVVECFIKEQKALGRNVHAHNFGSSPHVDHFRSFPHIYSAKVNEFLKHCCSTVVSKS